MGRVRKKPEERRAEIVDAALTLSATRGLQDVSVADIIATAQVSKGGFYHHFASKDDVLLAVVERLADVALASFVLVAQDPKLSATEKLRRILHDGPRQKRAAVGDEGLEAVRQSLFSDEGLALRTALVQQTIKKTAPLLQRVIDEGRSDGSMPRADDDVARRILLYGAALTNAAALDPGADMRAMLTAYWRDTARLLGMDEHALDDEGALSDAEDATAAR